MLGSADWSERHVTPDQIAQKCATLMMARDAASQGIGARVEAIGPGRAVMSMQVLAHMLNGHSICHGGYIFTLADSAFAFACNSYNKVALAQQNQITYLSPGRAGERLTAVAEEVSRAGRSGVYDVMVTGEDGRAVATFRGLSRTLSQTHFEERPETAE